MIVLDAYAVLALLKGEPAANEVYGLISGEEAFLTSLGVAEVVDHLVRLAGADEEEAALDLAQLGLMRPAPVDEAMGRGAGLLRARHYHRQRRAVSLADCVAAETARAIGAPLVSSDPHLLDMCHDEGIALVPLSDQGGRRWRP